MRFYGSGSANMSKTRDEAFADIVMGRATATAVGGRYDQLKILSIAGYTSVVFSARDTRDNQSVVLKFLKPWSDGYRTACFKREAQVGEQLLKRENIIQLVGAHSTFTIELVDKITGSTIPFPCEYFALERAGTSFTNFLFGHSRPRALYRRAEIMRDVVKGVNRLHNAGYCHRDLKPDNVLLFGRGIAKIADLGTCRLHSGVDPISADYVMPMGDLNYAAPEMFNGGGEIPELYLTADWFSVGAMLFEAVTGQNLYVAIGLRGPREIVNALAVGRDLKEYTKRVSEIAGRYPVPTTLDFSHEPWLVPLTDATHSRLTSLIRDLCHFDYKRRLTDFTSILRRLDLVIYYSRSDLQNQYKRLGRRRTV